jgi:hypothetical protein
MSGSLAIFPLFSIIHERRLGWGLSFMVYVGDLTTCMCILQSDVL